MELYLVRHGQSSNNALTGSQERHCDPPLTAVGERQADLAGQYLKAAPAKFPHGREHTDEGFGLTRLFCSAHRRCLQTATAIGRHTGLTPEIWLDVHEEMGIWLDGEDALPGLTPAEIAADFPGARLPDQINPQGWWSRPAETEDQWVERAARVARRLRGEMASTQERMAVVTHGGFTNDLLSALVSGGPMKGAAFTTQNTSIARIDFDSNGCQLRYINRVEHLPPELVT
jgi:broad specificity phosphatase PhoE